MAIEQHPRCDLDSNSQQTASRERFWQLPLGRRCQQVEAEFLAPWVAQLHGDTVVWAGDYAPASDPFERRMIKNPVWLVSREAATGSDQLVDFPKRRRSVVYASLLELPFQTASVDAVVLQHVLESDADPRVVLREVSRVLVPGGKMIISGFNPCSLLGLRQLYADHLNDCLSGRRMINPLRLFDWLTLLGLELETLPLYRAPGLFRNKLSEVTPNSESEVLPEERHKPQYLDPERLLARWGVQAKLRPLRRWLAELPFGGLMAVQAVKRSESYHMQWHGQMPRANAKPVTYPRIASWRRSNND